MYRSSATDGHRMCESGVALICMDVDEEIHIFSKALQECSFGVGRSTIAAQLVPESMQVRFGADGCGTQLHRVKRRRLWRCKCELDPSLIIRLVDGPEKEITH